MEDVDLDLGNNRFLQNYTMLTMLNHWEVEYVIKIFSSK